MNYDFLLEMLSLIGMSQSELARKADIPQRTLNSAINSRSKRFPVERVKRIADVLNIPVISLLGNDASALKDFKEILDKEKQEPESIKVKRLVPHLEKELASSKAVSSIEQAVNDVLKLLNEKGKEKALERVEELTEIPKYRKDEQE